MTKRSRRTKRLTEHRVYILPIFLFAIAVFYGGFYIGFSAAQATVGHSADQISGSRHNRLIFDLSAHGPGPGSDFIHVKGGNDPSIKHISLTIDKEVFAPYSTATGTWADLWIKDIGSNSILFPQDGGTAYPRIHTQLSGVGLDIEGAGTFPDRKVTVHDDLTVNSDAQVLGNIVSNGNTQAAQVIATQEVSAPKIKGTTMVVSNEITMYKTWFTGTPQQFTCENSCQSGVGTKGQCVAAWWNGQSNACSFNPSHGVGVCLCARFDQVG